MEYIDHASVAVAVSSVRRLLLELDSEGYLNQVGTVLSLAPAPANLGSAEVIKTGAFSRIGARDRAERPLPSARSQYLAVDMKLWLTWPVQV